MKQKRRWQTIGSAFLAALLINNVGIAADGPLVTDIEHTAVDHGIVKTQMPERDNVNKAGTNRELEEYESNGLAEEIRTENDNSIKTGAEIQPAEVAGEPLEIEIPSTEDMIFLEAGAEEDVEKEELIITIEEAPSPENTSDNAKERQETTNDESIDITVDSGMDDDALDAIIDDTTSEGSESIEAVPDDTSLPGTKVQTTDTTLEEQESVESERVETQEEKEIEMRAPIESVEKGTQERIATTKNYATKLQGMKPDAVEPLYVRELIAIESGRNDSNPVWSPNGQMIAFERSKGGKKEILIAQLDGTIIEKVYFRLPEKDNEMNFFFPGIFEDESYNAGISWSPAGDRFVFMSNGGGGNYDLYLRELGNKTTTRLTEHEEKDGQADWSPIAEYLLFVSGRGGKADVYLMNLADNQNTILTKESKSYLYPQWSPDGKKLAMIHGSNENHDIYRIDDVQRPTETCDALTTWIYDDLRPVWSPDGKKIAFYSNYNPENDPNTWCIIVIAADGSGPAEGDELVANVVATNVIPNIERGPAWMPDSSRIVYVKNDRQAYNPIYLVDIDKRIDLPLKTDTKMNNDVVCSAEGTIAFRSQVEQWDHVYVAKLKQ